LSIDGKTLARFPRLNSSLAMKNDSFIGEIMFKITQNGMNRLDIIMGGKLNSEEMKIVLDELVIKSKNIENGVMLYDVIDFHLP